MAEQKKGRKFSKNYIEGSKECQVAKEGRIEGIKTRSHKLKVVDRMRRVDGFRRGAMAG